VGYGELLRVLEEEATREVREIREAADRERERIVAEARRAADAARAALLERERAAGEARRRAAVEAAAQERERVLLVEKRALLEALRGEFASRLPASAGVEVLARLLREVLAEAGDGPFRVVVDPGEEEACREILARERPDLVARAEVVAAAASRGGVELHSGRRVLDDTLRSRLERAWPALESELAAILFEGA
jgi:V/A-type H+-transporting ATPase subunit E